MLNPVTVGNIRRCLVPAVACNNVRIAVVVHPGYIKPLAGRAGHLPVDPLPQAFLKPDFQNVSVSPLLPRDDVNILVTVQVGKFYIMCSNITNHMHPPMDTSNVEIFKPDEPFVIVPIGDDNIHVTVTVHIPYFCIRAPAVITGADRMPNPVGVLIPEQFASCPGDY